MENNLTIILNDPLISSKSKAMIAHELVTYMALQLSEKPSAYLISSHPKNLRH